MSAIRTNELDANRDIMVPANPEIAGLPNWVVVSVCWSASCSLHSSWIAFVFPQQWLKRPYEAEFLATITERQELLYARIAIFVVVLIAGYVE